MSRVTASGSQSTTLEPAAEATTEAASSAAPSAHPAPTSAATVEPYRDTMGKVTTSLTRSWSDLIITDRDVAKVHDALEKLPPHQYKRALEEMDRSGLLTAYLAEMTPAAEKQFLQQAVAKGWLKDAPIPLPTDPAYNPAGKAYDPPAVPRLIKKETWMPGPLRDALDRDFTSKREGYQAEYSQYMDRYLARLNQANHPATIRELGPIAEPIRFPGVKARNEHDLFEAREQKYNELMGRTPSGFVLQSRSAGVVVAGPIEHKAELEVTRLPNGRVEAKTTSVTEGDLKGRKAMIGTDDVGDLRGGAGTFEAKLSPKGKVEMEIVGEVGTFSLTGVKAGSKVIADPENATLMGGITIEARIGPLKFEQDLLFGFRGAQQETADRVGSTGGNFAPPELARGLRWEKLSEQRQKELSMLHSEKSWNDALDARARASLKR